ncbi:hypothetical protein KMP13_12815 [Epibacterium ulvae]|uniref:hypothetical protein n=1 Tax=Epibacterium ulvae TaxID=1156985 RepID=UPI001BFC712C|nr:hypothetical protein [Epibacterium ulvae]MBT8154752.1 hypothetical protein [Epibacterium ulvae]
MSDIARNWVPAKLWRYQIDPWTPLSTIVLPKAHHLGALRCKSPARLTESFLTKAQQMGGFFAVCIAAPQKMSKRAKK